MIRLSQRARLMVITLSVLLALLMVNWQIIGKEQTLAEGHTVLLELAPVDPRSLMQGDYMALRYSLAAQAARLLDEDAANSGHLVISTDENQVASLVGVYDGGQLESNQLLLHYRRRGHQLRLASDAFFFQEGHWQRYQSARYGELRVAENGDAILVGLRDREYRMLGTEPRDDLVSP